MAELQDYRKTNNKNKKKELIKNTFQNITSQDPTILLKEPWSAVGQMSVMASRKNPPQNPYPVTLLSTGMTSTVKQIYCKTSQQEAYLS
jgi:hypothetical protein